MTESLAGLGGTPNHAQLSRLESGQRFEQFGNQGFEETDRGTRSLQYGHSNLAARHVLLGRDVAIHRNHNRKSIALRSRKQCSIAQILPVQIIGARDVVPNEEGLQLGRDAMVEEDLQAAVSTFKLRITF